MLRPLSGFFTRLLASAFLAGPGQSSASARAIRLADSMADLEYAIATHERFRSWFASWLRFHILISLLLYFLLGLHVWAGIHFGLRWFR